jgi:eukaryotic-like serine/threonine-protein kinase
MSQLPALVGGKYRPIRLLGQGGMGIVYEVVHENTGEHLAMKLLLARSRLAPDLVERFRREARATTAVRSDHVVRVTDADVAPELDGAPFLVMELLEGQNFEELCLERRPSPEECVDWLRQIARALDRAHAQRVVHRDLKPENLFLAQRVELPPIVKVLDFGIAKVIGEAGSQTASGEILGTPRYMAPEQAGPDARDVSAASDRYALGLIAFRLLAGRHYFDENNLMKLLLDVTRGASAPPSARGCTSGPLFDAWFVRACAVDPGLRFASCFEQIEALARALGLAALASPTLDSSRPPARASDSDGSLPPVTDLEQAPTLEASVVTGRAKGVGMPRRTLLWAIGGLTAAAGAIWVGLRRDRAADDRRLRMADDQLPGTATSSPVGARMAVPGPPAIVPSPSAAPAASEQRVPTPRAASAAPKPRPAPVATGSARATAPTTTPKQESRVWDEP